jgi:hypothetical protein
MKNWIDKRITGDWSESRMSEVLDALLDELVSKDK